MLMSGERPRSPYVNWRKEEENFIGEVRPFSFLVLCSHLYAALCKGRRNGS